MFRKYWVMSLAVATAAVLAVSSLAVGRLGVASAARPSEAELAPASASEEAPAQQITAAGTYLWSYAAKFVCGYQPPSMAPGTLQGEFIVKPGNYASEINIHNPQYREQKVFKKLIILVDMRNPQQPRVVREPQTTGRVVTDTIVLGPDFATMDDCNRIYQWLSPAGGLPAFPPPLMIGYLVVLSRAELDVDVVYTAEVPGSAAALAQPTGISMDVERVTGKRVYVTPGVVFP